MVTRLGAASQREQCRIYRTKMEPNAGSQKYTCKYKLLRRVENLHIFEKITRNSWVSAILPREDHQNSKAAANDSLSRLFPTYLLTSIESKNAAPLPGVQTAIALVPNPACLG